MESTRICKICNKELDWKKVDLDNICQDCYEQINGPIFGSGARFVGHYYPGPRQIKKRGGPY